MKQFKNGFGWGVVAGAFVGIASGCLTVLVVAYLAGTI